MRKLINERIKRNNKREIKKKSKYKMNQFNFKFKEVNNNFEK